MKHACLFAAGLLALSGGAAVAEPSASMPFSVSHGALLGSLLSHGVLKDGRRLVHLSHTCNLVVEGASLPVVDLREMVKGASAPRGFSRVVVLDAGLRPLHAIEYGAARPLFCQGNRLFLHGDVSVDVVTPEGNVLVFEDSGTTVTTEVIDANDLPAPKVENGRIVVE